MSIIVLNPWYYKSGFSTEDKSGIVEKPIASEQSGYVRPNKSTGYVKSSPELGQTGPVQLLKSASVVPNYMSCGVTADSISSTGLC